jgi:hypothetical protein
MVGLRARNGSRKMIPTGPSNMRFGMDGSTLTGAESERAAFNRIELSLHARCNHIEFSLRPR